MFCASFRKGAVAAELIALAARLRHYRDVPTIRDAGDEEMPTISDVPVQGEDQVEDEEDHPASSSSQQVAPQASSPGHLASRTRVTGQLQFIVAPSPRLSRS